MKYTEPTELEQMSASEANAVLIELQRKCIQQERQIAELKSKYDSIVGLIKRNANNKRNEKDDFHFNIQ
jgi:hypothetical protein